MNTKTVFFTIFIFLAGLLSFYPIELFPRETGEQPDQLADTLFRYELMTMSLDEVLNLEIEAGSYIPSSLADLPVSITIIDKNSIRMTPARTLMDLIEVYVPGAFFVNHWNGPRFGFRGVMGDQNTSYLLLLNDQNINLQTSSGAFFEINNRDLNDIESIEVIRGPGSVRYGHGAIGGIINIRTLSDSLTPGVSAGGGIKPLYRSGNAFVKWSLNKKQLSFSGYAGIDASRGIKNPGFFYVDRAHGYGYGFMGREWGNKGLGTPAPNFYSDLWGNPQKKLQLDFRYKKSLKFWLRYSDAYQEKQQQQSFTADGEEFPGLMGKLFMSVLSYEPSLSETFKLYSQAGYSSGSYRDISFYQGVNAPSDDITQRKASLGENTLFLKARLNIDLQGKYKFALGGNVKYLWLGPEAGMGKKDFVNSFPAPILFAVYDTLNSGFWDKYSDRGIVSYVDETIGAYQYSGFIEANLSLLPSFSVLFSGRMDKHEFSEPAFSPRIAMIAELSDRQRLKMIAQKAVRLPTFNELYTFNKVVGEKVDPEIKSGLELMYNYHMKTGGYLDVSLFYSSIDQIAWTSQNYPDVVGRFDMIGLEGGFRYEINKGAGKLSFSWIKQTRWDPVSSPGAWLSNIGQDSLTVDFKNYGENRLNNFPGYSIKYYHNHRLSESMQLHFNGRINWGYGQADMLNSYKEIHDTYGRDETRTEMENIYETLISYGYSRPSFTGSFSFSFAPAFLDQSHIRIYAMNILKINHIRYVYQYWEEGNNRQYPRQVGFVTEPASVSIQWVYNF